MPCTVHYSAIFYRVHASGVFINNWEGDGAYIYNGRSCGRPIRTHAVVKKKMRRTEGRRRWLGPWKTLLVVNPCLIGHERLLVALFAPSPPSVWLSSTSSLSVHFSDSLGLINLYLFFWLIDRDCCFGFMATNEESCASSEITPRRASSLGKRKPWGS